MGCCVKLPYLSDNEYENIYRDILHSIPRLKYETFQKEFNKIIVDSTDEYINFSEEKYLQFSENFIDRNSPYCEFHRTLFPDWKSAWDLIFKDHFQSNISIWCFSLIAHSDRYQIIKDIMTSLDYNLDLSNFSEFLENYVYLNIKHFSSKILKQIYLLGKHPPVYIGGKLLETQEIAEIERIYLKLSDKTLLKSYTDDLKDKLKAVCKRHSNGNGKQDGCLTREIFQEFDLEHPYLWDALNLRVNYYDSVSHLG